LRFDLEIFSRRPHNFPLWTVAGRKTREKTNMAWMTPKVIEISIGMEINSYACAEL
jgi:coenzyme PQQ precursor peptide PqqA